jgi:hypothetical protein
MYIHTTTIIKKNVSTYFLNLTLLENNSFVLSTVGACSREETRGPVSPTVFVAPIRAAHRSSMKVCPSDSIRVVLVFIGVHPGASVMGIWGSCSPVVVFYAD